MKKKEFKYNFKKMKLLKNVNEIPDRPLLIDLRIPSTVSRNVDREECEEYDEMIDQEQFEADDIPVKTKIQISDFRVVCGKIRKYRKNTHKYNLSYFATRNFRWQKYQEDKKNNLVKTLFLTSEIISENLDIDRLNNCILIRKIKISLKEMESVLQKEIKKYLAIFFELLFLCGKNIFANSEWKTPKKIDPIDINIFKNNSQFFELAKKVPVEQYSDNLYKAISVLLVLIAEYKIFNICINKQTPDSHRRILAELTNDFIEISIFEKDKKRVRAKIMRMRNKIDFLTEKFSDSLIEKK